MRAWLRRKAVAVVVWGFAHEGVPRGLAFVAGRVLARVARCGTRPVPWC